MILLTGATGFIGRSLTRHLVESGQRVRILLRASSRSPNLPLGIPLDVSVTSLEDVRGLRAALKGVKVIYHLAGGEAEGARANLLSVDIEGTRNLVTAAADARVERIFYLSHLDADRASAFPVLKAKGIAEEYIRKSGVPHTILRASQLFGPGDSFTTGLAMMLALSPGFLPLPARGEALVQPLWVEDLSTCLTWALDLPETINKTIEIGGGEAMPLRQVAQEVMEAAHLKRLLLPLGTLPMRFLTVSLEAAFPRFPASIFWLDYLSLDRTCPVDSVARNFGLMPARFKARLDHLHGIQWGRQAWKRLLTRERA